MLPVVAVEALLFMRRRDLDKLCAISTRLEALMAAACATHPFRRVHRVHLECHMDNKIVASVFDVSIVENEGHETAFHLFETLDDALAYLAPFFRRSYVDECRVRLNFYDGKYRVSPRQWTDLTTILRSGAAPHVLFEYMDLSILPDNALVDAARCRKLEVSWCDVRGKLFSDDVLRSCAANGVLELSVWANKSEDEHTVSEEALLDFCFPPNGPSRRVAFDNLPAPSDTFAVRFFQRLLAPGRTSAPSGFMVFTTKQEQHGLADYVQCLVPDQPNPTYRFESRRDGEYAFHFVVDYRNHEYPHGYSSPLMEVYFGYFDLRPTNDVLPGDFHDDEDED